MNVLFVRCLRVGTISTAVIVGVLVLFASKTLHAGMIIGSEGLLTVTTNQQLRSYTFTGTLQQTLQITGLSGVLAGGSPEGVAVIGNRLFIGLVSPIALFTPKIVEVDPNTGAVLTVLNTVAPQITALGDDGVNLLVLDSVNVFNVYTYATNGALVSTVALQRPFSGNIQADGIDGDGVSIFTAYDSTNRPILTNTVGGAAVSYFDTNLPSNVFPGGLAYDRTDGTLWIADQSSVSEYRHYTQQGTLLSSFQADGAPITGLEVIHGFVPEPSTLTLLSLGTFGLLGKSRLRRRRVETPRVSVRAK